MHFLFSNIKKVCVCANVNVKRIKESENEKEELKQHFIVKRTFPLQPYCSLNLMCIRVTPFSHFFQVIVVFKYLVLFLFLFFFPIKPNANTHSSNNTITI